LAVQTVRECHDCGHSYGCKKENKPGCANSRVWWKTKAKDASDKEIIEYLQVLPSAQCRSKLEMNVDKIAEALAEGATVEYYGMLGVDMEYSPGEFLEEAEQIVKRNTVRLSDRNTNECVDCPPEVKKFCNGALPDGWYGFPDIYMREAMRRRILSQVQDLHR